jgi:hypothetical protein
MVVEELHPSKSKCCSSTIHLGKMKSQHSKTSRRCRANINYDGRSNNRF